MNNDGRLRGISAIVSRNDFLFEMRLKFSLILSAVLFLVSFWFYRSWEKQIVFGGDGWGYYAYLPASFIHHDLANLKTTLAVSVSYGHPLRKESPNPLGTDVPQHIGGGKQVIKYTSGVAMMMLPFFATAHAMAPLLDCPQDGFSMPYMLLATLAVVFFVVWGLRILAIVLREFFSETVTSLVVLTLAAATNLYFFTVYLTPMSHGYLFFWYACLVYATHFFYKKRKWRYAGLIGLSCGFITVTRPNEAICLLIPALYGIGNFDDLKARWRFVASHAGQVSAAVATFLLPILPQVIYWLWLTGKPVFYSYGEESFDFTNPQIINGLFHFKNGWLVYTPVMSLAVAGLFFLKKDNNWRLPVYAFLPLHLYIIYSWWCWYYINGFGSRPMVETYALLAFPLGHTLVFLMKNKTRKLALAGLLVFFAGLNLFQTWQLSKGLLWSEHGSSGYYFSVFGKTKLTYEALVAYDTKGIQPDSQDLQLVKLLYFNDFEDSTQVFLTEKIVKNGRFALALAGEATHSPALETTVGAAGIRSGDWIKFSAWCRSEREEKDWYRMNRMSIEFRRGQRLIRERSIRIENKVADNKPSIWGGKAGEWGRLHFFMKAPGNVDAADTLRVVILRDPSHVPVFVDDMRVELFRKK